VRRSAGGHWHGTMSRLAVPMRKVRREFTRADKVPVGRTALDVSHRAIPAHGFRECLQRHGHVCRLHAWLMEKCSSLRRISPVVVLAQYPPRIGRLLGWPTQASRISAGRYVVALSKIFLPFTRMSSSKSPLPPPRPSFLLTALHPFQGGRSFPCIQICAGAAVASVTRSAATS
jgi:hypothetical protein